MEDEPHPEWNSALEQVIQKEGESSEVLYWLHHHASLWAARRNDLIQIPSIILATVTGFFSATSEMLPPIAIGGLSVFVGILGTIGNYYKFSQRAEGHRIASLLYHKIYKRIETELSLPISQRTGAENFLEELRGEMARVSETAPIIPEAIIAKFKAQFPEATTSRPIIANGLDPIKIFREGPKTPRSPGIVSLPPTPQHSTVRIGLAV
jgi:hypothetical protein